ncbi:MAG: hypothetical protein AAFP22_18695, partial [Planctomycetota bacterium]
MGFTHYLDLDRPLTPEEWLRTQLAAVRIFNAANERGFDLVNVAGEADTGPEVSPNAIAFNGFGDNGYEGCAVKPWDLFAFCKTNRLPYGHAVLALYLFIGETLGAGTAKSDGEDEAGWRDVADELLDAAVLPHDAADARAAEAVDARRAADTSI